MYCLGAIHEEIISDEEREKYKERVEEDRKRRQKKFLGEEYAEDSKDKEEQKGESNGASFSPIPQGT